MKYLLDTHTLIWALVDDPKLTPEIKDIICDLDNTIYVSPLSIYEIMIKNRKKQELGLDTKTVTYLCQISGYVFLSLGIDSVMQIPDIKVKEGCEVNFDPFDRLLIAQSKNNDMIFLTHDSVMKNYDEKVIKVY